MDYRDFLKNKQTIIKPSGFDISTDSINPMLFEWQKDVVRWAVKKGKAALFLDCGLGKTVMQLEWMHQVLNHDGGIGLIFAPLAVAKQTQNEGEKFGYDVHIARGNHDLIEGINIANYEIMEHFELPQLTAIVLDESSIIKNQSSKTKTYLIEQCAAIPYKLACTATPAPNDFKELGTHSEFLGVMRQTEMLSTYFIHDSGDTAKWRLKGHAESKFWEWIASWAVVMTNPDDLGYEQCGYDLPPLNVVEHIVRADDFIDGSGQMMIVPKVKLTLNDRREARRDSMQARVRKAAEIANAIDSQVLIWCDLNAESEALSKAINGNIEIKGSDSTEYKTDGMMKFTDGDIKCLISKPSISGWGMNWQHCNHMIFVGLSDSFEAYYQAVRRCWRFGQDKEVNVHIVISEQEGAVRSNLLRKQTDAERMTLELVKHTKNILSADIRQSYKHVDTYNADKVMIIPQWIKEAKYEG